MVVLAKFVSCIWGERSKNQALKLEDSADISFFPGSLSSV